MEQPERATIQQYANALLNILVAEFLVLGLLFITYGIMWMTEFSSYVIVMAMISLGLNIILIIFTLRQRRWMVRRIKELSS